MLPNSVPAALVKFVAVSPSAVFSRSASTGRFSFPDMLKNALKKDQFVIHTNISPVPLYLLSKAFQIWFCIWFVRKCYRNALAEDEVEFGNFVKEAQRDKEYREVYCSISETVGSSVDLPAHTPLTFTLSCLLTIIPAEHVL